MTTNSVTALRQRELTQSTRAFRARGARVARCGHCQLRTSDCICAARPAPGGKSAVCIIYYKGEVYKPSNTGRLVADVLVDNHAFLWDRTRPDPALLALLNSPKYRPILVFPHQYAEAHRQIHAITTPPELNDRAPLFILLDGTWREAKKMFKSPYLADLPVLSVPTPEPSTYSLRDAAHPHQLCTAEIAIEVLRLANDQAAANDLADYYATFRRHYRRIRSRFAHDES